ncbi:hypothetical protein KI387_002766, partial [Taxus chinensis]
MKAIEDTSFSDALDKRIMYLHKLMKTDWRLLIGYLFTSRRVKVLFDKKARFREFQVRDTVLLWDKRHEPRGSHGKFDFPVARTFQDKTLC